jgi:hypothetical protein
MLRIWKIQNFIKEDSRKNNPDIAGGGHHGDNADGGGYGGKLINDGCR